MRDAARAPRRPDGLALLRQHPALAEAARGEARHDALAVGLAAAHGKPLRRAGRPDLLEHRCIGRARRVIVAENHLKRGPALFGLESQPRNVKGRSAAVDAILDVLQRGALATRQRELVAVRKLRELRLGRAAVRRCAAARRRAAARRLACAAAGTTTARSAARSAARSRFIAAGALAAEVTSGASGQATRGTRVPQIEASDADLERASLRVRHHTLNVVDVEPRLRRSNVHEHVRLLPCAPRPRRRGHRSPQRTKCVLRRERDTRVLAVTDEVAQLRADLAIVRPRHPLPADRDQQRRIQRRPKFMEPHEIRYRLRALVIMRLMVERAIHACDSERTLAPRLELVARRPDQPPSARNAERIGVSVAHCRRMQPSLVVVLRQLDVHYKHSKPVERHIARVVSGRRLMTAKPTRDESQGELGRQHRLERVDRLRGADDIVRSVAEARVERVNRVQPVVVRRQQRVHIARRKVAIRVYEKVVELRDIPCPLDSRTHADDERPCAMLVESHRHAKIRCEGVVSVASTVLIRATEHVNPNTAALVTVAPIVARNRIAPAAVAMIRPRPRTERERPVARRGRLGRRSRPERVDAGGSDSESCDAEQTKAAAAGDRTRV